MKCRFIRLYLTKLRLENPILITSIIYDVIKMSHQYDSSYIKLLFIFLILIFESWSRGNRQKAAYFHRFHRNFPCIWIIQPPFCYIAFDFWVFEFFSFSHRAFASVTVWFALNPLKSKTLDSEKMFLETIVWSFPYNQQTALWKLEPFLLQNCYFGYWLAFLRMMGHFNVIQRSF